MVTRQGALWANTLGSLGKLACFVNSVNNVKPVLGHLEWCYFSPYILKSKCRTRVPSSEVAASFGSFHPTVVEHTG